MEQERARKIGKCNMRKSLAWDSAFFTSAGFLEPHELSSMMKRADNGGKHVLPGIKEDMHTSIDSISTIESESLTLESLEADLFEDIRASIQKSSKVSKRTSSSSCKGAPGETVTQSLWPLKKVDLPSKNMMKPKTASKKQTIAMHGPGKLAKQCSGSKGTQLVASNGGVASSNPKLPKVIGRHNPSSSAPLKRASLDGSKVKRENDKTKWSSVPGKLGLVSTVSGVGGPFRTVSKPAPSSTSSSSNSVNGGKGISPVKSSRRIDSKTVNSVSSSSTLKNPSKVPLKKKGQAQLMLSNLTSNASPASSLSEWSSVSSSSTSTVNQRSSSSRVSIDCSSPCRSLDGDSLPALVNHSQSNDQIKIYEHKVNPRPSENLKKASTQSGALSRPATVQPTGLRMPSPKLGFFDGVKPVDRTPNAGMQSYPGIPPRPKIGARISNPNGASGKVNNTEQPTRTMTATGNLKLDSKKSASPVPSQKPLNASPKVSNVSGGVKNFFSIAAQGQSKIDGQCCLKAEKIVCEGPDRERTKSPVVSKSEVNLKKEDNTKLKDINGAPFEGGTCDLRSHCNVEKIKLPENAGKDANFGLKQLENSLNSLCKGSEQESTHFEDEVECFSMDVGAMVSKHEAQEGVIGKSVTQIDSSHLDSELSCLKNLSRLGEKGGSPSNLLGSTLISLFPVTYEIEVSTRTPLAIKNSLNEDDLSTRLSIGVTEKTTSFPSLESAQMENS